MMGTITSRLLTVASFRRTMTAASAVSAKVVTSGGMENALENASLTELLITWLMPHQQMSPDTANNDATTDFLSSFPRLRSASLCR